MTYVLNVFYKNTYFDKEETKHTYRFSTKEEAIQRIIKQITRALRADDPIRIQGEKEPKFEHEEELRKDIEECGIYKFGFFRFELN